MVSKTWRVSRSFKGYCNSPAYVACVCLCVCVCRSNSPPIPCLPLWIPSFFPLCVFTCNSCCWICCSWKRQLAHQTPLPERNRSVSLPRSRPGGATEQAHLCEAANKRHRRGKKPLLGIIAGNSFNGSRWKTLVNTGGNFANYCSMNLSNLILQLRPCMSLSLSFLLSLSFSITEPFSPARLLVEPLSAMTAAFTGRENIRNRLDKQFSRFFFSSRKSQSNDTSHCKPVLNSLVCSVQWEETDS